MSTRLKLFGAAGGIALLACLLAAVLRAPPEPTYKGFTMRQCLTNGSVEAYEALLVLGTNNLPLLTKRVGYDPRKDIRFLLFQNLYRLTRSARLYEFGISGTSLAEDAHGVFYRLGPKAAPAIPQLAAIAEHGGDHPSKRAMSILLSLGDEGVAVVASRAAHGNAQTRLYAVNLLSSHTESAIARSALTNALKDPDPKVQLAAMRPWLNPRQ
jgi:hypothetical protein